MLAGVITEELLNNIVIHNIKATEVCNAYIRITSEENLSIRIYDDKYPFDPRKEMERIKLEPAPNAEKISGLRLVKQITDQHGAFDYQNTAGINTSVISLYKF